jgi:hypothetical protein
LKKTATIIVFTAITFILSACNEQSKQVSPTHLPTNTPNAQVDHAVVTESNIPRNNEQSAHQTNNEENIHTATSSTPSSQLEHNDHQELFISSSNHYQVYLNDDFYITEEEPGIDAICYKANDALYMRIETFNKSDDATMEPLVANSKDFLTLASRGGQYTTISLPDAFLSSNYDDSYTYLVENESEKITLLLLALEDKIVRLTIFDDYITDVTYEFLTIGSTIK